MYEDIIFRGFHPTDWAKNEIIVNGKVIRGSWVEGTYMKHINRMPCPIGDQVKDEDIEHLILMSDPNADWNMPRNVKQYKVIPETVCIGTPYREKRKDKHNNIIFVGDVIYFNMGKLKLPRRYSADEVCLDNGINVYSGVVKRENHKFVVYGTDLKTKQEYEPVSLDWIVNDSNLDTLIITKTIFDDASDDTKSLANDNIEEIKNGRIIQIDWNCERGLTHYVSIQLEDGSHKLFGGYSLVNNGAYLWMMALMGALGIDRFDEKQLIGKYVDVKIVNNEPVAIRGASCLPWIDVRTVFKKEKN